MISRNKGSYTIEAALSLFVFMIAFLATVSYINIIKTESKIQHALNQAAYEISNYCYIADRAFDIGKEEGTKTSEAVDAVTSLISAFSSGSDISSDSSEAMISEKISTVKNSYQSIKNLSKSFEKSLEQNGNDISQTVSLIAETIVGDLIRDAAGRVAGITLGNLLVRDYISDETDLYGLEGGINAINFGLSSVLSDGRTVRLIAVYKIKLFGFGIFDVSYTVCQTATTHAWLYDKDDLSEETTVDIWKTDGKQRGKEFVSIYKKAAPYKAVKSGCGIDLYDRAKETVTSVVSVNPFCKSYSTYTPPESDEEADFSNYSLNKKAILSEIKQRASKLSGYASKISGKNINMDTGVTYKCGENLKCVLTVVLPNEANNKQWNKIFDEIKTEIEKTTGVKIEYAYRYYAL